MEMESFSQFMKRVEEVVMPLAPTTTSPISTSSSADPKVKKMVQAVKKQKAIDDAGDQLGANDMQKNQALSMTQNV